MRLAILFVLFPLLPGSSPRCGDKDGLKHLVSRSEIIALAEIMTVESPPLGLWSGTIETKQYVTYKVKNILKGSLTDSTIKVGHQLYRNSLSVDQEKPRLSPSLFRQGNTLLLFIVSKRTVSKEQNGTYRIGEELVSTNADCGAVVPDTDLLKKVEELLSSK